MKKVLLFVVAVAAIIVPAALAAAPAQNPTDYCKAHPELIGTGPLKLFKNMGACVKQQTAAADASKVNAAKTCMAQRDDANFAATHGGKTFAQFYGVNGDNGNGKAGEKAGGNAFGKCVSTIASAKTGSQQQAQLRAAKACRTAENAAKIGAGKTWRNFGACVKAQPKSS
jgi:hypothetical protein